MLGSAIPKRWVVSLALVGLVSLFMASYAAVWAGPASAGTVAGEFLTDLQAPTSLNLQTGQVVVLSVSPIDDDGNVDLGMPDVVYTWNAGSCGALSGDTSSRTPTFTASSSACTGTISVHANQDGGNVPPSDRVINVNVAAPPATPVPTAVPFDPTVIPVIVPAGLSAGDVSVILPSAGGSFSLEQAGGLPPVQLDIPSGALDSGSVAAVNIIVVAPADVPPPPPAATEGSSSGTFTFGSSIIDVQWYDSTGSALDTFQVNRPAEVCVPFTQADLDAAAGGPDGLALWRYNGTEWIQLNSTVNVSAGTVCGRTMNFSYFALGLSVTAPDTTGAPTGLPATGDYSPGVGALILAMLTGIALVATGAFVARRARRVRETS